MINFNTAQDFQCSIEFNRKINIVSCYHGVGVQWDINDHYEYSEQEWQIVLDRIKTFNPPIIRCLYRADIYCIDESHYDFNSKKFKELLRILDYCEENQIDVMLGEWDRPQGLTFIKGSDDPKWAAVIVQSLNYLLIEKGYTCIKYYNLVNEPNGDWAINEGGNNFEIWSKSIDNLYKQLAKYKLLDKIVIAGPDSTFADHWVDKCVDGFPEKIGCYEIHKYAWVNEVLSGQVEEIVRSKRSYIDAHDSSEKLFMMAEAGLIDGKNGKDQQKNVATFEYGLNMADLVVQTMRGGQCSVILWQLDDVMHNASNTLPQDGVYKEWGLWSSKEDSVRRWFYPMALLSNAFPKGAKVFTPEYDCKDIRVVCCEKDNHYTIAIINNSYYDGVINLHMSDLEKMRGYSYTIDHCPISNVLPDPVYEGDVVNGCLMKIQAKSMVLLTNIEF